MSHHTTLGKVASLDPKPNYEAPRRLAQQAGGWLAGKIWLKSAGLTSCIS